MSGIQLHVTEHAVGNKLVRQAYITKTAALTNARARVLDADGEREKKKVVETI